MSYQDYLRSDQWKALASKARKRANNSCEFCGGSPDHVHHVKYPANKNYQADCLENLAVVCMSCHNKQHGIRGLVMKEIAIIDLEGFKIVTTTTDDGIQWLRMKDAMMGIDAINKNNENFYARVTSRYDENRHWKFFENLNGDYPVVERFLSLEGFGIIASEYGKNEFAKKVRCEMADAWAKKKMGKFDFDEHEKSDQLLQSMAAIMQLRREQLSANLRINQHQAAIESIQSQVIQINEKIKDGISNVADLHYKTARMFLDENYTNTKIKSGSMFPGTNQTCAARFGSICSKKHNWSNETPPKIQEGTFNVYQWPIETLEKAFDEFLSMYSSNTNQSKLF